MKKNKITSRGLKGVTGKERDYPFYSGLTVSFHLVTGAVTFRRMRQSAELIE